MERAFQIVGSIPGAAPNFPWGEAIVEYLGALNLKQLESMVANPQQSELFIQNTLRQSGSSAALTGNGANAPSLPPSGLAPAQIAGTALPA